MKRMLAAGYEKVFQICRCWREGERGSQHIPEFTLLEWYRAGIDYRGLMRECEVMIRTVAGLPRGRRFSTRQKSTWPNHGRISVEEAFSRYARFRK
jgi:lysyl-tRNA synthetase class 2